jgi:hypothetical protein
MAGFNDGGVIFNGMSSTPNTPPLTSEVILYYKNDGNLYLLNGAGSVSQIALSGSAGGAGASGFSGYSGFSGATGSQGISGFSGFSGVSGFSGTSGFSGYSGTSGISGFSGFSGTNGTIGSNGVSGTSGFSGFSGVSGGTGSNGVSGTSGFSGVSGYSGGTGSNGVSGTSGFSGFSGVSGFSGSQGISGFSGSGGSANLFSVNISGAVPGPTTAQTSGSPYYLQSNGIWSNNISANNVQIGSLEYGTQTKTTNYNILTTDMVIVGDSTNGNITFNLPLVPNYGQTYEIYKKSLTNSITISAGNLQTISGLSSVTLNNQYNSTSLQWDGTQWYYSISGSVPAATVAEISAGNYFLNADGQWSTIPNFVGDTNGSAPIGLVPVMTSATTPSPYDIIAGTNFPNPWHLFDNVNTSTDEGGSSLGQFIVDFGSGANVVCDQFVSRAGNYNNGALTVTGVWEVDGSHDNVTYTTIQTGITVIYPPTSLPTTVNMTSTFSNTTGYRYYRFQLNPSVKIFVQYFQLYNIETPMAGLVPAPAIGDGFADMFLAASGAWQQIQTFSASAAGVVNAPTVFQISGNPPSYLLANNTWTSVISASNAQIGSLELTPQTKTANYTLATTDMVIVGDSTSGNLIFNLPATPNFGQTYEIYKKVSVNTITISGGATHTINGTSTQTLSGQYAISSLQWDGSQWYTSIGYSGFSGFSGYSGVSGYSGAGLTNAPSSQVLYGTTVSISSAPNIQVSPAGALVLTPTSNNDCLYAGGLTKPTSTFQGNVIWGNQTGTVGASAGQVGEVIANYGTGVSYGSQGVYSQICSITLTPGYWLVSAAACPGLWLIPPSSTANVSGCGIEVSTSSTPANGTLVGGFGGSLFGIGATACWFSTNKSSDVIQPTLTTPTVNFNCTTNTTLYLMAFIMWHEIGGADAWQGSIYAVRIF